LGKSRNLPHLHTLILRQNTISDDELKSFIATPLFAQLTSLDLSDNPLGDSGARVLAEAPDSIKLQTLCVRDCQLTEAGQKQLKRRFGSVVKL
jgi:Ran GTPase-activating protein (RanGAP) involved in mRNA processing and transport